MAFTSFSNLTIERNDTLDDLGFDSNLSRPIISEGGDSGSDDVTDAVTTLGGDITDLSNNLTEIQSVILDYTTSGAVTKGDVCKFSGSNMIKIAGSYVWGYKAEYTGTDSDMENEVIQDTCTVRGTTFIAILSNGLDYQHDTSIRIYDTSTNTFIGVYTIDVGYPSDDTHIMSPRNNFIIYSRNNDFKQFEISSTGSITLKNSSSGVYEDLIYSLQRISDTVWVACVDDGSYDLSWQSMVWNGSYYVYTGHNGYRWAQSTSVGALYSFDKNSNYIVVYYGGNLYKTYITVDSTTGIFTDAVFNTRVTYLYSDDYIKNINIDSSKRVSSISKNTSTNTTNYYYNNSSNTTISTSSTASTNISYSGYNIVMSDTVLGIYRLYDLGSTTYTTLSQLSVAEMNDDNQSKNTVCSTSEYNLYIFYKVDNRFRCRHFQKEIVYNYDDAVAIAQESVSSGNTGSFRLLRASDIDSTRTDLTTGTKYYDDIGLAVSPTQLYIIKDISDIIS